MNRLKLLVAAALLGLPLVACEEGTAPPPVGQIDGQVVVEGEGIDGVSVTLSSGAATTTTGGGYFSFVDVEGGTYTITISGYPDDASFDQTTAEVTIAQADQTINRNFTGSWIRTASLMGMVSVEGTGIAGITVAISGRQDAQMLTDDNGQYTFTGLRAGNYTVEISGFDATDVAFSATSSAVEVAVGESKVWSFEGTYVRESAVAGQVSVEGNGLSGVTVSLQGMGADEEQMTDAGGQYTFSNLRAGEYQLAISGYDTDEYGFSTTSATVRVEHGRTANVPFEGIMLRTASIMGQVSIEGEGLADVTVSLSGEGESQTRDDQRSRAVRVQRAASRQLPGRYLGLRHGRLLVRDHGEERRARARRDGDGALRGHPASHLGHQRPRQRRRHGPRQRDGHAFGRRPGRRHDDHDRRERAVRVRGPGRGATTRSRSPATTRSRSSSR